MNKKGFTLVELLAIIVILGILLTLGIPQVINAINTSKKKTFLEYIDKVAVTAQTTYQQKIEANDDLESKSAIFDITKDLGLSNTGSFKGYVLVTYDGDIYVTLYNDSYAIANYKFNSATSSEDRLRTISEVNTSDLTTDNLAKAGHSSTYYYMNNNNFSTKTVKNTKAVLMSGDNFNVALKKFVMPEITKSATYVGGIKHIVYTTDVDAALSNKVKVSDSSKSEEDIYLWYDADTGTATIACRNDKVYLHPNANLLFGYLTELTDVDLSHFITSDTITFSRMFQGSSAIQSLDVSNFDTSKGTGFRAIFHGLNKITSLDLSGWNLAKAQDLSYFFQGCSSLTSVDTTKFNSKVVTNIEYMFDRVKLTSIDLSNLGTANITKMDRAFSNAKNLTSITVAVKYGLDKLKSSTDMFLGSTKLPNYDATKVTIDYAYLYMTFV